MLSLVGASRGRPEKLQAALNGAKMLASSEPDLEILIRLDDDDPTLGLYPTGNEFIIGPRLDKGAAKPINEMAVRSTGELIMQFSDDQEFITPGWNTLIWNTAKNFVSIPTVFKVNEQRNKLENPIVNRAWLQTIGHLYHPEFTHLYSDTYVEVIAQLSNRLITIPEVTIIHHKLRAKDYTTEESRESAQSDFKKFIQLKPVIDAHVKNLNAISI